MKPRCPELQAGSSPLSSRAALVGRVRSLWRGAGSSSWRGTGSLLGARASRALSRRASLVAQLVKNPPAMQETWVRSLGWEDPLEKGKATNSSILAWKIPGVVKNQT